MKRNAVGAALSLAGMVVCTAVVLAQPEGRPQPHPQIPAANEHQNLTRQQEVNQPLGSGDGARPAVAEGFEELPAPRLEISGPFTHKNLSVYLLHAARAEAGRSYSTLPEALRKGSLIVHETGSVNTLAVENRSATEFVYIQAGEIVKGGRQDRVLSMDLVVPPGSGRISIQSFCVEQGRWRPRGTESAQEFNSAAAYLPNKSLKLAARYQKDQGAVWNGVRTTQEKLGANLGAPVTSSQSASSLPLTLETPAVAKAVEECTRTLWRAPESQGDVVGVAFAINGEMNSADVYGSTALLRKLWPKLLRAAAVEAVSEYDEKREIRPPTCQDVQTWLAVAHAGRLTEGRVQNGIPNEARESERNLLYGTREPETPRRYLHINYLSK